MYTRQSTPAKRAKCAQPLSCCSAMVVVENYNNFRKSGIPARFMYLCKGEWVDFPWETVCFLKQGFQNGKTAIEIAMRGSSSSYLVDFLRMSRIDLSDGFHTWIAWIDIHGKCFFPRVFCQGNPSFDIKICLGKPLQTGECEGITSNKNEKPTLVKSESEGTLEQGYMSESESTLEQGSSDSVPGEDHSQPCDEAQFPECGTFGVSYSGASTSASLELESGSFFGSKKSNNLMIKLEDGDKEFVAVRDRFLGGLRTLAALTTIVGIYRIVSGQARSQTFRRHAEDVARKSACGNANMRYAWHGTSNKAISGIILYGFGHPKTPKHGAAYGIGVYLAPENCAYISAAYSDVDENGEQHMVLCRVIMGNIEQVKHGSQQFHPSSEQFDTGIDDLKSPKRYIVWSTHMNTHILPEYVVSFRVPPPLREYWSKLKANQGITSVPRSPKCSLCNGQAYSGAACEIDGDQQLCPPLIKEATLKTQGNARVPSSAWMSFPKLFSIIEKFLSSSSVSLMKRQYASYKEGKISREDLIRKVRAISGDKLLISVIKMFRGQVVSSMKEKICPVRRN